MRSLKKTAVAAVTLVVLALPATALAAHPADSDHDGLNAVGEFHSQTNPLVADTDGDGTPDGLEDFDGDGILNKDELGFGIARIEDDVDDEDSLDSDDEDSLDTSGDSLDTSVSADSVDEESADDSVDED